MLVLVMATLAGGILTCVCAWPWFGLGAFFLAPFGAGSMAVFAGLLLAALRSRPPAVVREPGEVVQPLAARPAPHASVANDIVSDRRRRA